MRIRRLFAVTVLLVGAAAVFTIGIYMRRLDARPAAAEGSETVRFLKNPTPVPAFVARDLDGRTISSADWRGKVTLVNFWATWCPPCRAEIPELIALQEKYRGRLQIIGISEDEGSLEQVKQFVADNKINYPVVMASPEIDRIFSGISALPTSFFVDRDGRIVQKHLGMLKAAATELETRVLAGLAKNVRIELVDAAQAVGLENAAQAKDIPGVDLGRLPADRRTEALQRLNAEACTCGCGLTVAKCRIDDPTCGVSLPIARKIVDEIAARP